MDHRPLTVVQVLPALDSGGVERGTLEVARALVKSGHRALVISAGGRLVPRLEAWGGKHITWNIGAKSPFTLRYVYTLRRLLREHKVDILHARSRMPAWIAYLAWLGMRKKDRPRFVTTAHGFYSVNRYSAIMTRGEQVIAVSETVRDYLFKNYPGLAANRVQVIPRGIDPVEFPYDYRPRDGWLRQWYAQYPQLLDSFVITLPGRLTRLKGHLDFLDLLERLRAQGSAVHGLVVGGDDPARAAYAREIQRAAAARGLDNVIFTGYRDDLREIYTVSNLVLSLSAQPESFGRTVLEALAIGVPVVGYDHGGVGEILGNIYPQGKVPPGDISALTDKVLLLMRSHEKVPEQHTYLLSRMLDSTLSLYQDLADERSRHAARG